MNCPTCGIETPADQKFCRSCGTSLRMTTQRLVEPAVISDLDRASVVLQKVEKPRASNWLLWGFICMFVGVAIGVVGKKLLHDDIVTTVGILISLLGMFLTVFPYLSRVPRREYDSSLTAQPESLTQSRPKKHLVESHTQYIPSVIERTTDLLEVSDRTPRMPEERTGKRKGETETGG